MLLMREAPIRVETVHLEESPIRIISSMTHGASIKIIMCFSLHLCNQTIKDKNNNYTQVSVRNNNVAITLNSLICILFFFSASFTRVIT